MRAIRFYIAFLQCFLKWHLRLSRTKPGKWRYGKIWMTAMSYDKDRWIWKNEPKQNWFKRVQGPLEITTEYVHEGGNTGKGDYTFEIPPDCGHGSMFPKGKK